MSDEGNLDRENGVPDGRAASETPQQANRKRSGRRGPLKRRLVHAAIATLLGCGLLSAVDHAAHQFSAPREPRNLLFPGKSLVYHESCEFNVTVRTSPAGIRDGQTASGQPAAGTYRIAAVGDSFTFGWGVEAEESWPEVLEQSLAPPTRFSKIEVLNFGFPGASPVDYEHQARLALEAFRPRVLIVGFLQGDDLIQLHDSEFKRPPIWARLPETWFPFLTSRLKSPASHEPMTSYRKTFLLSSQYIRSQFDASQQTQYASLPVDVRQAFEQGLLNPTLIQKSITRPDYFAEPVALEQQWQTRVEQRLKSVLQTLRSECSRFDCRLIVALIPNGPYVSVEALAGARELGFDVDDEFLESDEPNRPLWRMCEQLKLSTIDLTPAFRSRKDEPLYFRWDGHFNAAGQRLCGEQIAEQLRAELP